MILGAVALACAMLYSETLCVDRSQGRYRLTRGFAWRPTLVAEGPVDELKWAAVGFRWLRRPGRHPLGLPTRMTGPQWFGILSGPDDQVHVFWPANPLDPEAVGRAVAALAAELGIPMQPAELELP